MNRRLLALFVLLCAALAVVAAPVNVEAREYDELEVREYDIEEIEARGVNEVLEARVKKAAKAPVKKPVAKPAAKPAPAVKKPVAAAPKPVPAKKTSVAPAKKPTTTAPKKAAPVTSCPLPAKKPVVRRFLEYIGVLARSTPAPACPTGSTSTPTTSTATAPLSKAEKKAQKAAQASAKAAAAAAKASAAAAAKRPVGTVASPPTKDVKCNDKTGAQTTIPLASIKTAVTLAQAGPLVLGSNAAKFPHVFNNREGVQVPAACQGKTLEEQAVGPDMSTFKNEPAALKNFNQFRVLITTPDASGDTTFCGVMTHGTSTTGTFEKDLCTEV